MQLAGFVYDAIWHGLLHPGVEPQSRGDMIVHLTAVHLPLYLGVLAVLLTTVWTFAEAMLQQRAQRCPPSCQPSRDRGAFGGKRYGPPHLAVAVAGALLSTLGEAWHAVMHLRLDTHAGAVAGSLSPVGLLLVAVATWRARRSSRTATGDQRRAA